VKRKYFLLSFFFLYYVICIHISLDASMIEVYKKGTIKITPDPSFGKDTDWDVYVRSSRKNIAVSDEGRIFVSIPGREIINIFDDTGKYFKTFGGKGRGPGDLSSPSHLSILDNKLLVVYEGYPNKRISLFDLDGNFKDILRVGVSLGGCVALRNNKIAFANVNNNYNLGKRKFSLHIIDITTRKEKKIVSYESTVQKFSKSNQLILMTPYDSRMRYAKTKDGNLLVGFPQEKEIKIFSPEGNLLRAFQLKMKREVITDEMKQKFYEQNNISNSPASYKKAVRATYFPRYIPFYRFILVDTAGNILVFPLRRAGPRVLKFQVYSPTGEYICDSSLDFGKYTPGGNIIFKDRFLYGLFMYLDKDKHAFHRLLKSKLY
jgi:hypothetical protein